MTRDCPKARRPWSTVSSASKIIGFQNSSSFGSIEFVVESPCSSFTFCCNCGTIEVLTCSVLLKSMPEGRMQDLDQCSRAHHAFVSHPCSLSRSPLTKRMPSKGLWGCMVASKDISSVLAACATMRCIRINLLATEAKDNLEMLPPPCSRTTQVMWKARRGQSK